MLWKYLELIYITLQHYYTTGFSVGLTGKNYYQAGRELIEGYQL